MRTDSFAAPAGLDEDSVKSFVAEQLDRVRTRSFGLTTEVLEDSELVAQHSRLMSPLVWDLAHVGNYEELWLLRAAAGVEAMRPEIDSLYDAFEHPRASRPTLPLLTPAEADDYIGLVRRKVLDSLEQIRFTPEQPLLCDGFVFGMVLQHEHQHDETMLATHQLRSGAPVLPATDDLRAPRSVPASPEVLVPGGWFPMGTSSDPWAYDNERPAHDVHVAPYFIDTVPVGNGDYLRFVENGGYDERRWWSVKGWDWRCESGERTPAFWMGESASWLRRRFGHVEPLPLGEPVQHVCWYEADAYARWAGRRLPSEAEWEKAASWDPDSQTKHRYPWGEAAPVPGHANLGMVRYHPTPTGSFPDSAAPSGALQMLGEVWEWTSSDFTGYPGFTSFPYREYSEVFFTSPASVGHKVLRGGSWASDPLACRNTFRNWDLPIRRQIFAGFRTARDA